MRHCDPTRPKPGALDKISWACTKCILWIKSLVPTLVWRGIIIKTDKGRRPTDRVIIRGITFDYLAPEGEAVVCVTNKLAKVWFPSWIQ